MLDSCNIYGTFLYDEKIYSPPECYIDIYDFSISVYNLDTSQAVSNVQWELYRRDVAISVYDMVDESHILVDSGIEPSGIIHIDLTDYNLRYMTTDYFFKTWREGNPNYIGRLRVNYYADGYTKNDNNWPYFRDALQIEPSKSSGGMGGDVVTHTEYRDRPLPVIRVCLIEDDEDTIDKEICIINLKDFDSL